METKFDQSIIDYAKRVADFDANKLAKEKLKILEKLQKVPYVDYDGNVYYRDITNLAPAQARIKLRYALMQNSKRISGLLKMRGIDFNVGWGYINRTFLGSNDRQTNEFLDNTIALGLNFMDTLKLSALKKYGAFLTDLYDLAMFQGYNLKFSAQLSRQQNLEEDDGANMVTGRYLPNTWKTYYKYIRQLEILTEKEKLFQNKVNILSQEN